MTPEDAAWSSKFDQLTEDEQIALIADSRIMLERVEKARIKFTSIGLVFTVLTLTFLFLSLKSMPEMMLKEKWITGIWILGVCCGIASFVYFIRSFKARFSEFDFFLQSSKERKIRNSVFDPQHVSNQQNSAALREHFIAVSGRKEQFLQYTDQIHRESRDSIDRKSMVDCGIVLFLYAVGFLICSQVALLF